jgi:adenylate cyclase
VIRLLICWVGLRAMVQERPVRVERRLSAILAADVAAYSRLMHQDGEAMHAQLSALLWAVSNPRLERTAVAS